MLTEEQTKTPRNKSGWILPGGKSNNIRGRNGRLGFSISDYGRYFLNKVETTGDPLTRLERLFQTAYEIATNTENKQCGQMIVWLVERSYGAVPKEISLNTAALQAILNSNMSAEARAYLVDQLVGDDPSYFVETSEEPDFDKIESAQVEVLTDGANGIQTE